MSSLSCFPAMRKFLGDSSILYSSISRFKVQGLPRVAGARGLSQLALCCTKLATPRLPDLQPKPVTLRARERARTGIAFSDSETDPKGPFSVHKNLQPTKFPGTSKYPYRGLVMGCSSSSPGPATVAPAAPAQQHKRSNAGMRNKL